MVIELTFRQFMVKGVISVITRMFFLLSLAICFVSIATTWAQKAAAEEFKYLFPVGTPVCRTIEDLKAVLQDPLAQVDCSRSPQPLNARYTREEVFVADGKPKQLISLRLPLDTDQDGKADTEVWLYSVEPITVSDHRKQRG